MNCHIKMKRIKLLLLSLICMLILTGCLSEEELNQNNLSFEAAYQYKFSLEAGNGKLWITIKTESDVKENPALKERKVIISIYDDAQETVLRQEIHSTVVDDYYKDVVVEDVDFDGNQDFYWPVEKGEYNNRYCFWLWDASREEFVADSYGLGDIVSPVFNARLRTVQGRVKYNENAEICTYYSYSKNGVEPKRMVTFHIPDYGAGEQVVTVEDYGMGELYLVRTSLDPDSSTETRAGIEKWMDLAYWLDSDSYWLEAGTEGESRTQPGFRIAMKAVRALQDMDFQLLSD